MVVTSLSYRIGSMPTDIRTTQASDAGSTVKVASAKLRRASLPAVIEAVPEPSSLLAR
jgi:hypothetical protein